MCVFSYAGLIFCCCDLDLDLMILIYELYSDILKMYLHTKGEVSRSRLSKVRAQTDREIHDQTRPNVLPATFTSVTTAVLVMRCVNGRGVCTQAPCYCIVMEYCPNGQLYEVLRNNHLLSSTLLVSWAQQIASGMSYVHSQKIIHRDLKSPKLVFTISN